MGADYLVTNYESNRSRSLLWLKSALVIVRGLRR
jgi:hypothetical protein